MPHLPRSLRRRLDAARRRAVLTERRLRESEEQFRLAFETAPAGMAVLDLSPGALGRFLRVNDAFCAFTGHDERTLLELRAVDVLHPLEAGDHEAGLRRAAEHAESEPAGVERRFVTSDGRVRWGRTATSLVPAGDGRGSRLLVLVDDVTEAREAQLALAHAALHDPLTGLPNRTLLGQRLARAATPGQRGADRVTVLYVDLDDFKAVNDTHGHAAGDAVLREVASLLRGVVREGDSVARLGGDEFAVVCPGLHGAAAGSMAARVQRTLSTAVELPGGAVVAVSASIGVATGEAGEEPDLLLERADRSMYGAKAHHRRAPEVAREGTPAGVCGPEACGGPGEVRTRRSVEALQAALAARAPVEQAKGFLAASLETTVAEASRMLLDAAVRRGVPVSALALELVEGSAAPAELAAG